MIIIIVIFFSFLNNNSPQVVPTAPLQQRFKSWRERYYNIQITEHGKLIGLINVQVNDDTVNTFH